MSCHRQCNQGRNCDCNPYQVGDIGPVLLIVFVMYVLSLFLWSLL